MNLENSAVAMGLEKVSFHSNPKEGQCQRIFKLMYNCAHFTCQEGYAQNPSRQSLAICELRTSRRTGSVSKRQRNQRLNCQHSLDHRETKGFQKNFYFCFPGSSDGKESACKARDPDSIPGSGKSSGEGNDSPLQYSYLENPTGRGAWQATGHGVTKGHT